jgi:hypothetical protein
MSQKPVHARFTETSQLLAEVNEFFYIRVRVDVRALLWGTVSQNVAQHGDMTYLLLCHESYQFAI